MKARIYKPAKNAMQSGKAKSDVWHLEFEPSSARTIDPLMGYTSSADMQAQVKLDFSSSEDAVEYCKKHGIAYQIFEPKKASRRRIAYADNFATNRVMPWTH